eukprot:scaffold626_cov337-Pavlova_lutheri.AAC.36
MINTVNANQVAAKTFSGLGCTVPCSRVSPFHCRCRKLFDASHLSRKNSPGAFLCSPWTRDIPQQYENSDIAFCATSVTVAEDMK